MKRYIIALAALFLFTGCFDDGVGNIIYVNGGTSEQTLDIKAPIGEGPFPAIIFIHGGSYKDGSLDDMKDEFNQAIGKGYVAVTINYRLTHPNLNVDSEIGLLNLKMPNAQSVG